MACDWRDSALKRAQIAAIVATGHPLIRLLGGTYRWRVSGASHLDAIAAAGHQPILAFWHGRILPATYYFRDRGIVVMTSENFDGEWIARIIERFGYGTSRGSTSRGARKALLQLVRDIGRGRPAGFAVDGPRGPARVVQPGAVWLAAATGHPVLPFHVEAARHWTLRSWDRTQIPKPFTTVALAIGEPVYLPKDTSEEAVEAARVDLEWRLMGLEAEARQLLSGQEGQEGQAGREG